MIGGRVATCNSALDFLHWVMATVLTIEVPGKGAYAPGKIGCRYGSFIKTKIPGSPDPIWAFQGKFFRADIPEEVEAFNALAQEIIPNCYSRSKRIRVSARAIILPDEKPAKKQAKKATKAAKAKPTPPVIVPETT